MQDYSNNTNTSQLSDNDELQSSSSPSPKHVNSMKKDEISLIREEFNLQRAKMKELYLQKEGEVKQAYKEKCQLQSELELCRKQLEHFEFVNQSQKGEIESLQYLVQETVEESSNASNSVIRDLQIKCTSLEQQLNFLNRQNNSSPDISLAPSALIQGVTKRIARRLGADSNSQESLEDSMKKAQEDADVLKSLVVPLEEEINELKEKLRDFDSQLKEAQQANEQNDRQSFGHSSSKEHLGQSCDMCANYEAQLVSEQSKCKEYTDQIRKLETSLKRAVEEVEREATLRRDTLAEWRAARTEAKNHAEALEESVNSANQQLAIAQSEVRHMRAEILDKVTQLTVDRKMLQERLDSLQLENEKLKGKYSACSETLGYEDINLPNNVTELQEYVLKLREELIIALMGRERAQESEQTVVFLQKEVEKFENVNDTLKHQYDTLSMKFEQFKEEREQLKILRKEVVQTSEKKRELESQVRELRNRVSSLQQDLDNSEIVQKDFVKLSQSLQVQLERIRESDVEVRWQHDEDVDDCSTCHHTFTSPKQKQHCRHCGRIFCGNCLTKYVNSGPRGRKAHVCEVCHTLLVRDTAPYFSTEVPHSPS